MSKENFNAPQVDGVVATLDNLQRAKDEHDFFETIPFDVRRGKETLTIDIPIGASEPE